MRRRLHAHSPVGLAAALVLAVSLPAQGQERTVQVTVTAVGDRSVYLDHGRDVGFVVGTLVRLFPPGAGELEVEVRAVSQTSARADVPPGVALPPVGTQGEARVVVAAAAPSPGAVPPPTRAVPEHPPWMRREDPRAPDQPLLVPTFGQRPEQRPATLDGRLIASSQWNLDRSGDADAEYWLSRLGVRADAVNQFGAAERVRIAGEFDDRRVAIDGRPDSDDQNLRLDLASVAFGTEHYAATGLEVGRFFSPHLPEIGLVDGAEVVRRFEGGLQVGVGLGAYPRPFPAHDTGDDFGLHVFADYTADAARSLATTFGVQKTWHRGEADRDLLLWRGEWRPARRVWLLASSKVDIYTGSDRIKGSGAELTEALVQARWDGDDLGTGVMLSRFTWPELKRAEYQDLPAELVRDGFVERVGWNGRWRAATWLSLRARADSWHDQDRSGETFGGDFDVQRLWNQTSVLSVSTFLIDGGYSSGPGARVTLRDRLGDVSWRAGYRWHRYELSALVTGPESYTRQSIELGASCPLGRNGDLDLSFERWFGDREDAFAAGFYLQWRF